MHRISVRETESKRLFALGLILLALSIVGAYVYNHSQGKTVYADVLWKTWISKNATVYSFAVGGGEIAVANSGHCAYIINPARNKMIKPFCFKKGSVVDVKYMNDEFLFLSNTGLLVVTDVNGHVKKTIRVPENMFALYVDKDLVALCGKTCYILYLHNKTINKVVLNISTVFWDPVRYGNYLYIPVKLADGRGEIVVYDIVKRKVIQTVLMNYMPYYLKLCEDKVDTLFAITRYGMYLFDIADNGTLKLDFKSKFKVPIISVAINEGCTKFALSTKDTIVFTDGHKGKYILKGGTATALMWLDDNVLLIGARGVVYSIKIPELRTLPTSVA